MTTNGQRTDSRWEVPANVAMFEAELTVRLDGPKNLEEVCLSAIMRSNLYRGTFHFQFQQEKNQFDG